MNCPNCHTLCKDTDRFCHFCGASLRSEDAYRGSLWVPLLLLAAMSVIGLIVFFVTA